jgi:hypothetical protein
MVHQSVCLLAVIYLGAITATNMKFDMGINHKQA